MRPPSRSWRSTLALAGRTAVLLLRAGRARARDARKVRKLNLPCGTGDSAYSAEFANPTRYWTPLHAQDVGGVLDCAGDRLRERPEAAGRPVNRCRCTRPPVDSASPPLRLCPWLLVKRLTERPGSLNRFEWWSRDVLRQARNPDSKALAEGEQRLAHRTARGARELYELSLALRRRASLAPAVGACCNGAVDTTSRPPGRVWRRCSKSKNSLQSSDDRIYAPYRPPSRSRRRNCDPG